MGICTRCGYLTNDKIKEVHECSDAYVSVGKEAWKMAQDSAVVKGMIDVDVSGSITEKK
jgi:hypothetical protein